MAEAPPNKWETYVENYLKWIQITKIRKEVIGMMWCFAYNAKAQALK